jgi:hypothetical protein
MTLVHDPDALVLPDYPDEMRPDEPDHDDAEADENREDLADCLATLRNYQVYGPGAFKTRSETVAARDLNISMRGVDLDRFAEEVAGSLAAAAMKGRVGVI